MLFYHIAGRIVKADICIKKNLFFLVKINNTAFQNPILSVCTSDISVNIMQVGAYATLPRNKLCQLSQSCVSIV